MEEESWVKSVGILRVLAAVGRNTKGVVRRRKPK